MSRAGCFAGLLLGPARGAHAQLSSRAAPHTGQTAARCRMLCCPTSCHMADLSTVLSSMPSKVYVFGQLSYWNQHRYRDFLVDRIDGKGALPEA